MLFLVVALVARGLYARVRAGRKPWEAVIVLALFLLMPVALVLTDIVAPKHSFSVLMGHQLQLVFPLLAALLCIEGTGPSQKVLSMVAVSLMVGALVVCAIRAFATYAVVELSYRYVETVTSTALQRVMTDEEYTAGDTIVFAGFPDESHLKEAMPLQAYSYFGSQSAVFWQQPQFYRLWQPYVLSAFGMDIGMVDAETMNAIATSEEFGEMGCFPDESSVGRVDGYSVVKFSEDCVIGG